MFAAALAASAIMAGGVSAQKATRVLRHLSTVWSHVYQAAPQAVGITYDDLQKLSYNEVRGTGLAAVCPTIDEGSTDLQAIKPGTYKLQVAYTSMIASGVIHRAEV